MRHPTRNQEVVSVVRGGNIRQEAEPLHDTHFYCPLCCIDASGLRRRPSIHLSCPCADTGSGMSTDTGILGSSRPLASRVRNETATGTMLTPRGGLARRLRERGDNDGTVGTGRLYRAEPSLMAPCRLPRA